MIGIDVSIAIRADNDYLLIPVIPAELTYTDGNATPTTVNIMSVGAVDFGNGVDLDTLAWSCFFPARYDPAYCAVSNLKDPIAYRNQFSTWKDNDTVLQVVIPSAGINKKMKVTAFPWKFKGFEGDIYYDLTLKEHKEIKPIQVSAAVAKIAAPPAREAAPVAATIKKGDKVKFKGGPVYTSSNAATVAVNRKEAMCNCTLTYNGKHPYHLIHYSGDIVYGWVDAANCEKL